MLHGFSPPLMGTSYSSFCPSFPPSGLAIGGPYSSASAPSTLSLYSMPTSGDGAASPAGGNGECIPGKVPWTMGAWYVLLTRSRLFVPVPIALVPTIIFPRPYYPSLGSLTNQCSSSCLRNQPSSRPSRRSRLG